METIFKYCQVLKFSNEATGMCCASGKVVLSPLPTPPEPLKSLLAGELEDWKLFLRKTRKFNSCFQMTSFGATKICNLASDEPNFKTKFKIEFLNGSTVKPGSKGNFNFKLKSTIKCFGTCYLKT